MSKYENERDQLMRETSEAFKDLVVAGDTNNMALGVQGLTVLVGGALCDLRRIAAAVEKLATDGPALTAEEAKTVAALRRGDIQVVKAPSSEEGVIAYFKDHALHGKTGQVAWSDLSELERNEWRRRYRDFLG